MQQVKLFFDYLMQHKLRLATAESCTAGALIAMLADQSGCGDSIDCGYVVYSPAAKQRLLNVSAHTIDKFGLTSEEVAREMAVGALRGSDAQVAIANTGIAGPQPKDGIAPGTVCLAWGFQYHDAIYLRSETKLFGGNRNAVRKNAALYAIENFPKIHWDILREIVGTVLEREPAAR